ncbi:heat shock protein 75 kda, mitochondrial, partial [Plakobranchus ocellatus]
KLRQVLTTRILKFFSEKAKKDPLAYRKFYEDYGLFFREGIVTTSEQDQRENIAKLLRFESSKLAEGELTSLEEYGQRMKPGERNIYFLCTPSRQLAENSPYLEALRKRNIEVLFLYEAYDELVLMNLGEFDRKNLKSIENELYEDKEDTDTVDASDENSLRQSEVDDLKVWLKSILLNKVNEIKVTKRLESHPCIITVLEMGSARHFLRTTLADKSQEERLRLLQPTLELNPSHPLIVKMHKLKDSEPKIASLLAEQSRFRVDRVNPAAARQTLKQSWRLPGRLQSAFGGHHRDTRVFLAAAILTLESFWGRVTLACYTANGESCIL